MRYSLILVSAILSDEHSLVSVLLSQCHPMIPVNTIQCTLQHVPWHRAYYLEGGSGEVSLSYTSFCQAPQILCMPRTSVFLWLNHHSCTPFHRLPGTNFPQNSKELSPDLIFVMEWDRHRFMYSQQNCIWTHMNSHWQTLRTWHGFSLTNIKCTPSKIIFDP